MASSSSSRRKGKVVRIARNDNPIGTISDEDIQGKLLSLRKIKTLVSHRYLKLVRMFYSNLKIWIGYQQVYPISESWSPNKTDLTKAEEDEWAKWYAVKIDCMSESLKIDCMSESLKIFLGLK
ncbi:hypothetical protein LR48_Vigan02g069700 [Vigna angularis]|uniref:Uncharacterized protein n=1 Tax=Phaseolus angularis TaxID=3914 RepID=A0A0L9TVX0_PHAAN|nr:hypothetical protein LR48_Vigan02g069700 [Vigna angularis]